MPPELKTRTALEILDVTEAQFNTDEKTGKMTAKVQVIKAGRAIGKKRVYTSSAIQQAAKEGIYNGLRMFVNHSDKTPLKRSLKELVSAVESTEYNPKTDAIDGTVEFFNKDFYDYAERARKYMGVSASQQIQVTNVREGQETIQRVTHIPTAESVDWVIYPAAGGEVLSFAQESEETEDVDWDKVTLDDLKEHAPKILESYKSEVTKESEDDEDDEEPKKKPVAKKVVEGEDEDARITRIVQEQVRDIQDKSDKAAAAKSAVTKKVREQVAKGGLPSKIQARLVNQFSDETEYVKESVDAAIAEAKEELKEAGLGPRIHGNGPTGEHLEEGETRQRVSVRESVEAGFGVKKEAPKKDADDKK